MSTTILQLIPRLDTGGAERSTIDMVAALADAGYGALVASEGGRLEQELASKGGVLFRMKMDSKSPLTIFLNGWRLAELIRSQNIKLIHARSRAPAWSGLLAARLTQTPFIATYHGLYSGKTSLKRWYNSVMVRGCAVIANSHFTAEHIARVYPQAASRIVTIPRGLDEDVFDPAKLDLARVKALRESWGVRAGETIVLLPGRLTRWKGQSVLIAAMKALGRNDVRAVLAGDAQGRNDYEAELRAEILAAGLTDQIVIAGHISDMASAYAASDIVVSTSVKPEAFGRIAAEAAAMERPVIASDHGGARETVVPEGSGLLTPPGDAPTLTAALSRLLAAGPQGRAAMGAKGRTHVLARFTRARMCADTMALYRRILSEASQDAHR